MNKNSCHKLWGFIITENNRGQTTITLRALDFVNGQGAYKHDVKGFEIGALRLGAYSRTERRGTPFRNIGILESAIDDLLTAPAVTGVSVAETILL